MSEPISAMDSETNSLSQVSLQLIADSLPVLVAYIDQNFRYTYVNETYVQWLGIPRSEMIGRHVKEVQSPAIYEAVAPTIARALRGEKSTYELKIPSRLGGFRYIEGIYTPDIGLDGEVRGVISHVADITDKKRIEKALQRSQDNDQFLAESSQVLSANLEVDQLFQSLGPLLVPRVADWYGIELLNEKGELETVTAWHRDPDKVKLAQLMRKKYPSDPKETAGPYAVLKSGRIERIEFLSDEMIAAGAANEEHLQMMKSLGLRSVVCVPLRVRGEMIGVMNLVHAESGRTFDSVDVNLIQALAYRTGLAIENAKLYAETKRQKDRLYSLLMSAPIAIAVRRGPNLVYELANEPYLKALGCGKEILGKPYLEVMPKTSPELLEKLRQTAVEGKRFVESELTVRMDWNRNGKPFEKIFNIVYEPLLDANGKSEGIISFSSEITEQVLARRKVEETAENFRVLTETIPHLVWTARSDGQMDYFNERWYAYTGLSREEALSGKYLDMIHPEDVIRMKENWSHSLKTGALFDYEYRLKRAADGQYRWFKVRALPIRDESGPIEKWLGTSTEIQEQKELEETLIKARVGAEKASLAKSNFLANMSHEIRTPMTAVLGFTEILQDPDLPADLRSDYVSRIDRSGRSLLRLIDDILDISKIEAGQLNFEKQSFSPVEIVQEVLGMLKTPADSRNLKLRINLQSDVPEKIISDPTRVRQILVNLIGNAVKFTLAGEVVVSLLWENKGSQDLLTFEVKDTGIGISREDQPKLFSAFVQADDSITRTFGGSGLGLALSRRLAEKLGGHLELVSSAPGKGSVFRTRIACETQASTEWISKGEISLKSEPMRQAPSSHRMDAHLKGVSVLLAEDMADTRALIRTYLQSVGARVDMAENGHEAVQRALSQDYHLILMDIQMPLMDGLQATKILRSKGYEGPILALTAHAMHEERLFSLEAGCTDHVTKPIGRKDLIHQILKHISSSQN